MGSAGTPHTHWSFPRHLRLALPPPSVLLPRAFFFSCIFRSVPNLQKSPLAFFKFTCFQPGRPPYSSRVISRALCGEGGGQPNTPSAQSRVSAIIVHHTKRTLRTHSCIGAHSSLHTLRVDKELVCQGLSAGVRASLSIVSEQHAEQTLDDQRGSKKKKGVMRWS